MTRHWYAVHTYSGFENKVMKHLEEAVRNRALEDKFGKILVPTEDVAEIRDGKKRVATKKIFPGYIIVEMELDDETWHLVKETPGVTGFVGSAHAPAPLTEEEVANILHHMEETEEQPRPKITFERGEKVKVIEGPFFNFTGTVAEINSERGRLKVMVDILGRQTAVELDFLQVEKQ